MSIIGTLPTTIANGQVEDATVVMSLFAWIQSQTNGNACPATVGSAVLKGDGAGGTTSGVDGTDFLSPFTVAASLKPLTSAASIGYLPAGVSSTSITALTIGYTYIISTLGSSTTSNWIAAGATTGVVGEVFTATAVSTGSGTATLWGSVQAKLRDTVSVKGYGAIGDGVADDTAAFQAAHTALPTNGGRIFVPAGTYKLTGTITFTKPVLLEGDQASSSGSSTLITSSATLDVFVIASGFAVKNINCTSSVVRTAGAYFKGTNVSRVLFSNLFMNLYFNAINIDGGSEIRIEHSSFFDGTAGATAAGSCAIRLGANNYTGSIVMLGLYIKCQNGGLQCSYGIRAQYVDVLNMSGVTIIQHGTDFQIDPGTGQTASLVFADSCTFDTAINGVAMIPTGTGRIIRSAFAKCWFGQHSVNGFAVDGSAGAVDDISITGCIASNNTSCGINVTGANAKNIRIIENTIAGDQLAGVRLTTNASNVRVLNNDIGPAGAASGNVTGLAIDATVSGEVRGNSITGNTTNISNASNLMLGIWNSYTPTVTATSGTFTTVIPVGAFVQVDKTVHFRISIGITSNGTASGGINFTLPVTTSKGAVAFLGRGIGSGKQVQGYVAASGNIAVAYNYDGTYAGGTGETLVINGTYEAT